VGVGKFIDEFGGDIAGVAGAFDDGIDEVWCVAELGEDLLVFLGSAGSDALHHGYLISHGWLALRVVRS